MATAKKAAPAAKKASAADVDDLLGGKSKAPAKRAAKATVGTVEDVKKVLLKVTKLTSYNDVAEANNFDIRMVRRTARALGDEGLIERVKEGTVVFVKKATGKK